ncbi:MAG: hypothetical protein Q9195_009284 [Heterodermia aff. obscurata]
MEVFVRNLPDTMTERQVKKFFEPWLTRLQIYTFRVDKHANKNFALLTFVSGSAGQRFLLEHGQTQQGKIGFNQVKTKLFHMGKPVNCTQSTNTPDKHIVSSLRDEELRRITRVSSTDPDSTILYKPPKVQRVFAINSVSCGQWGFSKEEPIFRSHFHTMVTGRILFGHGAVVLDLHSSDLKTPKQQIVMRYDSIESTVTGHQDQNSPPISFSLTEAPKLYEKIPPPTENDVLVQSMRTMALQLPSHRVPYNPVKRKRISGLNKSHQNVVASCLCYRVTLVDRHDMKSVRALEKIPRNKIPRSIAFDTVMSFDPAHAFPAQITKLNNALTGARFAQFPFGAKFQLQRLAQNGYLPPSRVFDLMDVVAKLSQGISWSVKTRAIRRLSNQIPYAGPATDPYELSSQALSYLLVDSIDSIIKEDSYSNGYSEQPEQIAQILKATVTPTGIYLYGPEPEMKNRVLRKYSAHTDYFLQVSFLDENSEQLWYDRVTSIEDIYHKRFKGVLDSTINIAGRGYEFLGFSHSSLRAQTCWFMAPFTIDNQLLYAKGVIARLGDFSTIRWPARCAARIGQAFSQTFSSVTLPAEAIKSMPDVTRNGRVFSDGVGTCSSSVLEVVHEAYGQSRIMKPTLLQIRFQGAKGMISLDNRIKGHAIYLRPSMIKFEGSTAYDIEICGAAFKPLPMYLNRQLIKILEDLGVPDEAFLTLQDEAIRQLRDATTSPVNATNFLRRVHVGQSARLPGLFLALRDIGISYSDDAFLRHVLEVCVLVELRELKHRSRIRVADGMTLYGIMDETGFLQEGEIYCSVYNADGPLILTGDVVITRCPALHPGDVQCVNAVDVPQESPLRALQNCVVFSQHGERDLPSKLSGGDLDGDLYNIIYDDSLYPPKTADPANYGRVQPIDIGRPVISSDMSDFFVQFMKNDALGRIATLHQTLADIHPQGVFHPDCIKLAELHSDAVDFSKTGIPVDLKAIPKGAKVKPDFQAPGPRVLMENLITLDNLEDHVDMEEIEELDEYTAPTPKYYRSEKVLGKLYRAIDEHQLLKEIQRSDHTQDPSKSQESQFNAVWKFIQDKTALIQYAHYIDFARNIKADYEDILLHTMFDYASQPHHHVSEVEVVSGAIIGKNGAQSKRQRDYSTTMKERHERDVDYIVRCILQGEDTSGTEEALERSIACFWIGHQEITESKRVGRLVSFGWIAAGVCLSEVKKFERKMKMGEMPQLGYY